MLLLTPETTHVATTSCAAAVRVYGGIVGGVVVNGVWCTAREAIRQPAQENARGEEEHWRRLCAAAC